MLLLSFFQYRLETDNRQTNGGIWKAPAHYSFTKKTPSQTEIIVIEKFGTWNEGLTIFDIKRRMPWLPGDDRIMLYTSDDLFQLLPHGVVIQWVQDSWLYGTGAFLWRGFIPGAYTGRVVYSLREEPGRWNL